MHDAGCSHNVQMLLYERTGAEGGAVVSGDWSSEEKEERTFEAFIETFLAKHGVRRWS